MDTNKALGAAGAGQIVRALGREWTVLPPTRLCLARFQAWLESEARRKLVAGKADIDADTYAEMLSKTLDQINTGYYSIGEPAFDAAIHTYTGLLQFMTILLQQKHPEVNPEQCEKLMQDAPEEFKIVLTSYGRSSLPKEEETKEGGP